MTEAEKIAKLREMVEDCDRQFLSSSSSVKFILERFYNEAKAIVKTPTSPMRITKDTFRLMVPKRCPLCREENILVTLTTEEILIVTLNEDGIAYTMDESEPDGNVLKPDYYRCPDCGNEFFFDGEYQISAEELFGQ